MARHTVLSDSIQDLLADLVMWECLDKQEVNPKLILRTVSLPELSILAANIDTGEDYLEKFVVVQMIKVELMYRKGLLKGDWTFLRCGQKINLRYAMAPNQMVSSFHDVETVGWAMA
jgi:hypothetical protein